MKRDYYFTPHKCPVCGKYEFEGHGSFDICDVCGWEDDDFQERHPDEDGGANHLSLNEYRKKYESGWRPEWLNDPDDEDEMAEDEHDVSIADEAYQEYIDDGRKSRPVSGLWEDLGL